MASLPGETVLFLTSSEYGQANVIIATAYEFLLRNEFNVHIASYASLAPRVHWLNKEVVKMRRKNQGGQSGNNSQAIFHEMSGVSMVDNIKNSNITWPHKTGINHTVQSYKDMARVVIREDTHNYISAFDSCLSIIKTVKPSVVVVEPLCLPGADACLAGDVDFLQLYPTSFYDICLDKQPRGELLWKYPVSSSGYPFPLPLHLIPANIYLFVQIVLKFVLGNVANALKLARTTHGINFPLPLGPIADRILCPSLPEIDFPFSVIPENIISCGPIILPAPPVSKSDPALARWLSRHPTILINLGSNHSTDPISALEMAHSISSILSNHPKLQVLWKLKYDWQTDPEFQKTVKSTLETERLLICSWLIPEAVSILTSGNVIAFVHHGGANSYYESCYAGIPQVLLPVWYDTYLYAAKVEFLGIGVYGSKDSSPGVSRREFTEALESVLGDEKMRDKATAIGKLCGKTVGREVACDSITEWARKRKTT